MPEEPIKAGPFTKQKATLPLAPVKEGPQPLLTIQACLVKLITLEIVFFIQVADR